MERGTDTGSQTLIDATVAMAASSRLAYLVSYFANPGGDWQGALIKYLFHERRQSPGNAVFLIVRPLNSTSSVTFPLAPSFCRRENDAREDGGGRGVSPAVTGPCHCRTDAHPS